MYERRDEPLLTRAEFAVRWLVHFLVAIGFVVLSLAAGMLGFVYFENKHVNSFHDALLNAAMLLGGMGPIQFQRHLAASSLPPCTPYMRGSSPAIL
jgi:hypothetical protein